MSSFLACTQLGGLRIAGVGIGFPYNSITQGIFAVNVASGHRQLYGPPVDIPPGSTIEAFLGATRVSPLAQPLVVYPVMVGPMPAYLVLFDDVYVPPPPDLLALELPPPDGLPPEPDIPIE